MQMQWTLPQQPARPATAWDSRLSAGLWLGGGQRRFEDQAQVREDLGAGLKLAILLEGAFDLGVAGAGPTTIAGASSSLFVSRNGWQLDHSFAGGSALHYLTLFLDAALVEDVLEQDLSAALCRGEVHHTTRATPDLMAGLARRILHRPFTGAAGRLHDSAKALELAALALDQMGAPRRIDSSLASPAEVARLHDLHAFLAEHWRDLPTLDRLARQFGFSARRMTAGFRRLFGCTIAEHLRELRLREGWRLIDAGMSATLAAEHTGYTLPHFTSAFQRRFGVTPGALARKGTGGATSEKFDR